MIAFGHYLSPLRLLVMALGAGSGAVLCAWLMIARPGKQHIWGVFAVWLMMIVLLASMVKLY